LKLPGQKLREQIVCKAMLEPVSMGVKQAPIEFVHGSQFILRIFLCTAVFTPTGKHASIAKKWIIIIVRNAWITAKPVLTPAPIASFARDA
jgi:hypothetical protein